MLASKMIILSFEIEPGPVYTSILGQPSICSILVSYVLDSVRKSLANVHNTLDLIQSFSLCCQVLFLYMFYRRFYADLHVGCLPKDVEIDQSNDPSCNLDSHLHIVFGM